MDEVVEGGLEPAHHAGIGERAPVLLGELLRPGGARVVAADEGFQARLLARRQLLGAQVDAGDGAEGLLRIVGLRPALLRERADSGRRWSGADRERGRRALGARFERSAAPREKLAPLRPQPPLLIDAP